MTSLFLLVKKKGLNQYLLKKCRKQSRENILKIVIVKT